MKQNYSDIYESIKHIKQWIETDLRELDGDTESDYAKFVLSGHKHLKVAIETMEELIDPTRGYAE